MLRGLRTGAISLGVAMMATSAMAATECVKSKWGPDDTLGSANLISPENTLKAAALIKQGKSHPLGIVIDSKTPAFPPRTLNLQVVSPGQAGGNQLSQFGYPAIYNDDVLQTWVGIGSQIDGLGHLGEARAQLFELALHRRNAVTALAHRRLTGGVAIGGGGGGRCLRGLLWLFRIRHAVSGEPREA